MALRAREVSDQLNLKQFAFICRVVDIKHGMDKKFDVVSIKHEEDKTYVVICLDGGTLETLELQ